MELMEIIKSSLSIFSVVSFVFILTAYTIFKIKDRSRIKPYLRVNMQSAYNDIIIEEIVNDDKKNLPEKKDDIQIQQNSNLNKPQVYGRFEIVNPIKVEQKSITEAEPEIEKPIRKIKLSNPKLNIYEFYSETNEKMHKLKLA